MKKTLIIFTMAALLIALFSLSTAAYANQDFPFNYHDLSMEHQPWYDRDFHRDTYEKEFSQYNGTKEQEPLIENQAAVWNHSGLDTFSHPGKDQVNLVVGETISLAIPDYLTEHQYSFYTDNAAVAMVDKTGLVTATGLGEALITFIASNGIHKQVVVIVGPDNKQQNAFSITSTTQYGSIRGKITLPENDVADHILYFTVNAKLNSSSQWQQFSTYVTMQQGQREVEYLIENIPMGLTNSEYIVSYNHYDNSGRGIWMLVTLISIAP